MGLDRLRLLPFSDGRASKLRLKTILPPSVASSDVSRSSCANTCCCASSIVSSWDCIGVHVCATTAVIAARIPFSDPGANKALGEQLGPFGMLACTNLCGSNSVSHELSFVLHESFRMSPLSNAGCCLAVDCYLAELRVRLLMFIVYMIQLRVGAIVLSRHAGLL